jgi:hypothetical protein
MWIWCLTKYSISITVKQISFKLKKYIYLQNIRVSTEETPYVGAVGKQVAIGIKFEYYIENITVLG